MPRAVALSAIAHGLVVVGVQLAAAWPAERPAGPAIAAMLFEAAQPHAPTPSNAPAPTLPPLPRPPAPQVPQPSQPAPAHAPARAEPRRRDAPRPPLPATPAVSPQKAPAAAGVDPVAVSETEARPLSGAQGNRPPDYPRAAIRRGEQGTVVLRIEVSPQGRATSVTVERSSGFDDLDESARTRILRDWQFAPATRAGQPVAGTAVQAVPFGLTE